MGDVCKGYRRLSFWVGVVSVLLIALHAYLSTKWPGAALLRALYDSPAGPPSKGSLSFLFDGAVPAGTLAFVAGRSFYKRGDGGRGILHILIATALYCALLIALLPVYACILHSPPLEWPGDQSAIIGFLARRYAGMVIFFGMAGTGVWIASDKEAKENIAQ